MTALKFTDSVFWARHPDFTHEFIVKQNEESSTGLIMACWMTTSERERLNASISDETLLMCQLDESALDVFDRVVTFEHVTEGTLENVISDSFSQSAFVNGIPLFSTTTDPLAFDLKCDNLHQAELHGIVHPVYILPSFDVFFSRSDDGRVGMDGGTVRVFIRREWLTEQERWRYNKHHAFHIFDMDATYVNNVRKVALQ